MTGDDYDKKDDAYYSEMAAIMRSNVKRGGREGTSDILALTPVESGQNILDIGIGTGEASLFFSRAGLKVTGTTLYAESFGIETEKFRQCGVKIVECPVEDMPFEDEEFDACWMSHILEHTMNPGIALQNVWRVLKPEGWLFIMVPPYKSKVVGGHLITGWNIGQLMYLLLLNNFNVKDGHFVKLAYNICGFVRKANYTLPELHSDIGDIENLTNYWPKHFSQGFEGDMASINWPPPGKMP